MRPAHPLDIVERRPIKRLLPDTVGIDAEHNIRLGPSPYREKQIVDSERIVWLAVQWALVATVLGWVAWMLAV